MRPAMGGRPLGHWTNCTFAVASSVCQSRRRGSEHTCSGVHRHAIKQSIQLPNQSLCTAILFCRCISTPSSAQATVGQSCFCATRLETFAYTAETAVHSGALARCDIVPTPIFGPHNEDCAHVRWPWFCLCLMQELFQPGRPDVFSGRACQPSCNGIGLQPGVL